MWTAWNSRHGFNMSTSDYDTKGGNGMFGLSIATAFFSLIYPLILFIGSLIYLLKGSYEGKKEEEEFNLDDWYRTF